MFSPKGKPKPDSRFVRSSGPGTAGHRGFAA